MNATQHTTIEKLFKEISPEDLAKLIEDAREKFTQYVLRDNDRDGDTGDVADEIYYLKRLSQTLRKLSHSNVNRAC